MKIEAKQLISDFKLTGYKTDKLFERLYNVALVSEDAFLFASEFLKTFTKRATVFSDILSYINEAQFKALIHDALQILKSDDNENAETVIELASLQFPELLHTHLELIFELNPNGSSYSANYPWRNLAKGEIEIFKNKLLSSTTEQCDKEKLFKCLLQTRDSETVAFAYKYALETLLFKENNFEDFLLAHLELVGFTLRNGVVVNYCPNATKHFVFPEHTFLKADSMHYSKEQHPTWQLEVTDRQYQFGGIIQEDHNNPFMHIITFDTIPSDIKISGLSQLTLGAHIRELNENGNVFYHHDAIGNPIKIGEIVAIDDCVDLPIKQSKIEFAITPKRWEFQSWINSDGNENLFRLGGEPTWIQSGEVPNCPICNDKMDFLMQLDSELLDTEDGEVYFGSGGICYVFWCDKSKVSGYVMQCT